MRKTILLSLLFIIALSSITIQGSAWYYPVYIKTITATSPSHVTSDGSNFYVITQDTVTEVSIYDEDLNFTSSFQTNELTAECITIHNNQYIIVGHRNGKITKYNMNGGYLQTYDAGARVRDLVSDSTYIYVAQGSTGMKKLNMNTNMFSNFPAGLAISTYLAISGNTLWISQNAFDYSSDWIKIMRTDGTVIKSIVGSSHFLLNPYAMDFDSEGNCIIYNVVSGTEKLYYFDSNGYLLETLNVAYYSRGMAINNNDKMSFTDIERDRINLYSMAAPSDPYSTWTGGGGINGGGGYEVNGFVLSLILLTLATFVFITKRK